MGVGKIWGQITQYILGAVARIFGPNDDEYPNIGVQPFEGEAYREKSDTE